MKIARVEASISPGRRGNFFFSDSLTMNVRERGNRRTGCRAAAATATAVALIVAFEYISSVSLPRFARSFGAAVTHYSVKDGDVYLSRIFTVRTH